ncbi:hypothetical protein [Amycolatopsis sp. lyj-23]|uniref:hypothetical protein n=1 Tax=Amycolatopsis sp. lyj-23 TaxID=2789283 RepID=UPI00397B3468
MPRRRPHELRAAARHRPAWREVPHVPGLPAALLEEVLAALPSSSAARLARLIRPSDELFLERSLPDPKAPARRPWCERC